MNRCFFWHLILEFQQNLKCFIMTIESHKDISLLEFIQRILFVNLLSFLEPSQSLLWLAAVVTDHTHVSVENWRSLIDWNSTLQQLWCLIKLFLLEANVSKTPPCVVVALISWKSSLIAFLCSVEIFISHILMTAQRVSIGKIDIKLDSSREESEGSFMLLLERVTVSHNTPCLRCK